MEKNIFKLRIFDAYKPENRRFVPKSYYKNMHGIILMYDITDQNSFILVSNWLNSIKNKNDNKYLCMILVGNRFDSPDRKVTEEEGKRLADECGCQFLEISTDNNKNINEVLENLTREIYNAQKKKEKEEESFDAANK